jgi:hypothetical protein
MNFHESAPEEFRYRSVYVDERDAEECLVPPEDAPRNRLKDHAPVLSTPSKTKPQRPFSYLTSWRHLWLP